MRRLGIIGSNDLGKLIAHHAMEDNWQVAGFFDNKKSVGTEIENYGKILGNIDSIEELFQNKVFDCLMIGVGYTQFKFRKIVFERFKGKIVFGNIVHKNAFVDKSALLGEGIFVLPGCTIDVGAKINDNILLNTGVTIAHHSEIGKHTFVAPGVTIAGYANVGEGCFLGVGSIILDNVIITSDTLIGGGAVVTKSIEKSGTYVGIPAKRIKDNIYI